MPAFRGRGGFRHRRGTQELPALHEDRHSRRPVPAPERHRTARTFRHGIYRRQGGGSVLLSGRLWRFPFLCTTTHTGTEKDRQKAHGRNIYDRLEQFLRFRGERDLLFEEVDSNLMVEYETFLKGINVCPNSSSFYMRNLRAIYNRAVERELTVQRYPFKHVYTGVDKTVKRAVPLKVIRRIRDLDLTLSPVLDYARDLFMFSFYTRGMAFVDMAYLKKKDLQNGVLVYRRQKTGQQLFIKWEKPMQEIVGKYDTSATPYLLPIIRDMDTDARKQYKNAAHLVNDKLKK